MTNAADIIADIKYRGFDAQSGYGQFVKARDLKPEISMPEFIEIYKTVTATPLPIVSEYKSGVTVGDTVSYTDVNLWSDKGKLTRISGKKAWVIWDRWQQLGEVEEWLPNLRAWN